MKSDFEERRENRKARYEDLAIKNEKESTGRFKTAKGIGDHIPFGQPILVGHHSEGRHRRDLAKIDNNMRKSVEADRKSDYYADKAKNIENDTTIYSDDPEAIVKLKEKIGSLEANQTLMKLANKIIKSKKPEVQKIDELVHLGLTEKQALEIMTPGRFAGMGFASYSLTNNNANINRNKKRLKQLVQLESQETKEFEINGVRVVDNVEDNRLQLFFPDKPGEAIRKDLKSKAFRWTPSIGCWQTHRSNWANRKANDLLKNLNDKATS